LETFVHTIAAPEQHEIWDNARAYTEKLVARRVIDPITGTQSLVALQHLAPFTVLGFVPGEVVPDGAILADRKPWEVPVLHRAPSVLLFHPSYAESGNLLEALYSERESLSLEKKPVEVRCIWFYWRGSPRLVYMTGPSHAPPGTPLIGCEAMRPTASAAEVIPPRVHCLETMAPALLGSGLGLKDRRAIVRDYIKRAAREQRAPAEGESPTKRRRLVV
jgi:hypothetical protein